MHSRVPLCPLTASLRPLAPLPAWVPAPGANIMTLYRSLVGSFLPVKDNFYFTPLTHFQASGDGLWLWSHAYSRILCAVHRHDGPPRERRGLLDQCCSPETRWLFAPTMVQQPWFLFSFFFFSSLKYIFQRLGQWNGLNASVVYKIIILIKGAY